MQTTKLSARMLAWMQRIAILAFVLFWSSFLFDHTRLDPFVIDFEFCFVLPDLAWIVGSLAFASHWLFVNDERGKPASAGAGGAMVFLGLLDVAFNIRHHQYGGGSGLGILNVLINTACIAFGLLNLNYALALALHRKDI